MSERLAIVGASGFVGSALTEYALEHTDYSVTPFCHSTGGATRLAHRAIEVPRLDLLDRDNVETALRGFDYVVNCSRGGRQLMLDGLDNLLRASQKAGIKKLVHLSSVAVYGDPPHPQSANEDAPAQPSPGSYGDLKLAQDEKVQRAAANGMGAVILCPPNITGPGSDYLIDIIRSIEAGRFRLIDGGSHPINVVDVNNLGACILGALASDVKDGRRLFACEPAHVTWRDLCEELEPVIRGNGEIPSLSVDEFVSPAANTTGPAPARSRFRGTFKHLVSDEVRTALRLHPGWALMEAKAKAGVRMLGKGTEDHLRATFNGPVKVRKAEPEEWLDRPLVAQQLRDVKHDPGRCQRELRFQPPLSFAGSMQSFRNWYLEYFEPDSAEWKLLGEAARPRGQVSR